MGAGARHIAGRQQVALDRDARHGQGIEARFHGIQDGGRGIVAGQFQEYGLLLAGFGQGGVDAAAFLGRLRGVAGGGIFHLARQAQARTHDLVVDARKRRDFVQQFGAVGQRIRRAAQTVDGDCRHAGKQDADGEQGAQDHAADGDVFQ